MRYNKLSLKRRAELGPLFLERFEERRRLQILIDQNTGWIDALTDLINKHYGVGVYIPIECLHTFGWVKK